MQWQDVFAITPFPAISALLWIVLAVAVLYLARSSAHNVILSVCQTLHELTRHAAQALASGEERLSSRNRDVLLAAGREAKERVVEREFERVADSVHKDLGGYPALQRSLSEAITKIEEDHRRAVDVPPDPPGWVAAVEAVAKIDTRKDKTVGTILEDMRTVLGVLGIGLMRLGQLALGLVGKLFEHLGTALVKVYDIPIFMPLWLEAARHKQQARDDAKNLTEAGS